MKRKKILKVVCVFLGIYILGLLFIMYSHKIMKARDKTTIKMQNLSNEKSTSKGILVKTIRQWSLVYFSFYMPIFFIAWAAEGTIKAKLRDNERL